MRLTNIKHTVRVLGLWEERAGTMEDLPCPPTYIPQLKSTSHASTSKIKSIKTPKHAFRSPAPKQYTTNPKHNLYLRLEQETMYSMLTLIPSLKKLLPPSSSHSSRLRHLQKPSMLLRMRLLHIPLRHLLHHKVPIDLHFLRQLAVHHPPLRRNRQRANGGAWR